jgi:queuine tRNA-ribosyltransferase
VVSEPRFGPRGTGTIFGETFAHDALYKGRILSQSPTPGNAAAFQLVATDGSARRGTLTLTHGTVQTPAFMPVGTLGAVKGVTVDQVRETGAEIILGNTYHLALRPGADIVEQLGGLHRFSGWDGPILTDSGGFQIFSLAKLTKITDAGATFRSHIDGAVFELSPERAIRIQEQLGSDIAMALDHVPPLPSPPEVVREAHERSLRWAARCKDASRRADQAVFAIVQGGLDAELRVESAERLAELDFPGYAVGGLSVGEPPPEMYRMLDVTCPALPVQKPRYLMGVGRPEDLLEGIARGIDMFDCVMPTRNGRNALAFTDEGPLRLRNQRHASDEAPLEADCPCPACRHSRGYLRHLFAAKEMLGPILLSIHNLTYYQRLMQRARTAIEAGEFAEFHEERRRGVGGGFCEFGCRGRRFLLRAGGEARYKPGPSMRNPLLCRPNDSLRLANDVLRRRCVGVRDFVATDVSGAWSPTAGGGARSRCDRYGQAD